MNSIELKDFINNIQILTGYKSIYRINYNFTKDNLYTKMAQYYIKYRPDSMLRHGSNRFVSSTYNIESLKITYTTGKRSFNLRRNKNKSVTTVIVVPITLLKKDDIGKMISNIHGYEIDSVEFISMLKISQEIEDDEEYVRTIEILGQTFYQHLRIDALQRCEIKYDGVYIYEIKRIKMRAYAKVPLLTTVDKNTQFDVRPQSISFEEDEIEQDGS